MNRIQYLVTEYQSLWFVILQDRRHGPYPSQQAAIDEAILGAQTVPGSEVLVKTEVEQVRTVWIDGTDPECRPVRA